jgi:hypothetical protein
MSSAESLKPFDFMSLMRLEINDGSHIPLSATAEKVVAVSNAISSNVFFILL